MTRDAIQAAATLPIDQLDEHELCLRGVHLFSALDRMIQERAVPDFFIDEQAKYTHAYKMEMMMNEIRNITWRVNPV